MIILSDALRDKTDEGCIKVASSLVKRLKAKGAKVISLNNACKYSDKQINVNKILLSKSLFSEIRKAEGDILYIPFASNTLGSAVRTLVLSKKTKKKINVLFSLRWEMNYLSKLLLRISKCNILTLSRESKEFFDECFPKNSVKNISTGVDIRLFTPADREKKKELRKKYGIPCDKTIILHVGHMKQGRNVEALLSIEPPYFVLLVVSSVTEKDSALLNSFAEKGNAMVIEDYVEKIEELYQAADLYIFPVIKENNSIDIPVSVLEASSCNLRIIATPYHEINYFDKCDGLDVWKVNIEEINDRIKYSLLNESVNTRSIALKYDWTNAVDEITKFIR